MRNHSLFDYVLHRDGMEMTSSSSSLRKPAWLPACSVRLAIIFYARAQKKLHDNNSLHPVAIKFQIKNHVTINIDLNYFFSRK